MCGVVSGFKGALQVMRNGGPIETGKGGSL